MPAQAGTQLARVCAPEDSRGGAEVRAL